MKRKAEDIEDNDSIMSWSSGSNASVSPDRPWSFTGLTRPFEQKLTGRDHMNLRTRKRFRDNRPDENTIHKATLAKLFMAQTDESKFRQTPRTQDSCSPPIRCHESKISAQSQQDLHSFFNIRQEARARQYAPPSVELMPICEDCGTRLANTMALGQQSYSDDMELDQEYACHVCSRHICDMCAVRGDHRVCLECAMPGS